MAMEILIVIISRTVLSFCHEKNCYSSCYSLNKVHWKTGRLNGCMSLFLDLMCFQIIVEPLAAEI